MKIDTSVAKKKRSHHFMVIITFLYNLFSIRKNLGAEHQILKCQGEKIDNLFSNSQGVITFGKNKITSFWIYKNFQI